MHKSVLLKEIVDGLEIKKGDIVVDGTVNGGGMSAEILRRFGDGIRLIVNDQDQGALERAKEALGESSATYILGNFKDIRANLEKIGVGKIDRFLLDLGLSSNQLEGGNRGFSFKSDEPLLMTLEEIPSEGRLTAKEIVNEWEVENLATIIQTYGEEKKGWKIAQAIVKARDGKLIETSRQLADIVENAVPRHSKIHPATKTFQALRMAVNSELQNLETVLGDGFELLTDNGRMAVISFHSLEDRIVKNFIREKDDQGLGIRVTKKPIVPSEEEIRNNPRSRSAKLRIVQKLK